MLPVSSMICARSLGVVALAEQAVEHLARVVLHRQRLSRRAERDGAAEAAAERGSHAPPPPSPASSMDGSVVSCPMCWAAIWSALVPAFGCWLIGRSHATEPRARDDPVRARALAGLVTQAGDDRHVLLVRLERLQDLRQLESRARFLRLPARLHRAMREVDEADARLRCRGRVGERRGRGNHRIQQRQGDGDARPAQHRATGQMLLGDEHCRIPSLLNLRTSARGLRRSFFGGHLPLLEWVAVHDLHHDRREPIVVFRGLAHDGAHRRHVVVLDEAAERVRHQLLGERLHELLGVREQRVAQIVRAVDAACRPAARRRSR